jgi:hypothetical protein
MSLTAGRLVMRPDAALPKLLDRAFAEGHRVVVRAGSLERGIMRRLRRAKPIGSRNRSRTRRISLMAVVGRSSGARPTGGRKP